MTLTAKHIKINRVDYFVPSSDGFFSRKVFGSSRLRCGWYESNGHKMLKLTGDTCANVGNEHSSPAMVFRSKDSPKRGEIDATDSKSMKTFLACFRQRARMRHTRTKWILLNICLVFQSAEAVVPFACRIQNRTEHTAIGKRAAHTLHQWCIEFMVNS